MLCSFVHAYQNFEIIFSFHPQDPGMGTKLHRKADNHVPDYPVSYLRRTVLDVSKTDVSKETSETLT